MREKIEAIDELQKIANDIRVDIIMMLAKAGSGHPGGSLSIVEILVALFFNIMKIDPRNPAWDGRDRFHLSKGHACPALYAVLARLGYFSQEELGTLRTLGSILQGHPHPKAPGIEVASGSLGQGLSVACGMALSDRLSKKGSFVYVVLGDGELQEGQVWEAALFASQFKLDNLIVIIDNNGLQIDGKVEDIISVYPLREKWESFGFQVSEVDGHDIGQLLDTIKTVQAIQGKPKVIIAKTVKGKAVSFMENNLDFHGRAPKDDETNSALNELQGQ